MVRSLPTQHGDADGSIFSSQRGEATLQVELSNVPWEWARVVEDIMLCTVQAPCAPVGVDIGLEVRETLVVIWPPPKSAAGAGIAAHHLRDVLIVWAPTGALPLSTSVIAPSIATAGTVDAAAEYSGWTRPPAWPMFTCRRLSTTLPDACVLQRQPYLRV